MPSPFPGMDPYLESPALWPGFHYSLIYTIRAALTPALPAGYYAELDQYVWLTGGPDGEERVVKPDVFVAAARPPEGRRGGAAVADPTDRTTLPAARKHKGNRFIRIMDQADNRVVTVIEVLSPSNKEPGDDRASYLAKRNEYLATGTNLVEFDLLRDGDRIPLGRPKPAPTDYVILVSRAEDFPRADVWRFAVRDPLPVVPVPLKPGHDDVPLDPRPCLDRAYDEAGYAARVDYAALPKPLLRQADAAWAAELLAGRKGGG